MQGSLRGRVKLNPRCLVCIGRNDRLLQSLDLCLQFGRPMAHLEGMAACHAQLTAQLAHRAAAPDVPAVHDGDAITQALNIVQAVGGQQDGDALLVGKLLTDQGVERLRGGPIQPFRRLI